MHTSKSVAFGEKTSNKVANERNYKVLGDLLMVSKISGIKPSCIPCRQAWTWSYSSTNKQLNKDYHSMEYGSKPKWKNHINKTDKERLRVPLLGTHQESQVLALDRTCKTSYSGMLPLFPHSFLLKLSSVLPLPRRHMLQQYVTWIEGNITMLVTEKVASNKIPRG